MVYTRYRFAADFCRDRRVLEVACGPGVGLGYLSRDAQAIVGGDVTASLLHRARMNLPATPLVRFQAEALPLRSASCDVIVCYEALYFLEDARKFVQECRRVLAPDGYLLVCSVNPDWPDFNPSSHSRQYYSARQLGQLLDEAGFQTELLAAFPVERTSLRAHVVSWIKRAAAAVRIIPSTMQGKRFLKRLFLGKLVFFPTTIEDGMAAYCPPLPISRFPITDHKILFAVGRSV